MIPTNINRIVTERGCELYHLLSTKGLTKRERGGTTRQAQNRLRLFEFKTEINRWVYCKREKKK